MVPECFVVPPDRDSNSWPARLAACCSWRPASGGGVLLAHGGPGRALARPALERRHDAAEGVVAIQHVDFREVAALGVPGEPGIRERLKLEGQEVPAEAAVVLRVRVAGGGWR